MTPKISLVRRLAAGVRAFSAGYGAGISTFQPYEAAGFSRKRPIIYGAHARDSKIDLTESTRTELLKLARHMYRNIGIVKGAVDSIASYSIGAGLVPQYRGADQQFGTLCEAYWRDVVTPAPEVTGRMGWTDLLMALSRSIDIDGDVFVLLTDSGKLQVVEAHRVCESENYGTTDGVFLGQTGEPTAYLVEAGEDYLKLDASLVIHLMEIERPDQIRGASGLSRALNHLRDLKLVTEFEKDALKVQSSIAAVITTHEGDPIANTGGFFGKIQERETDNDIAREEISTSANIPRLAPGEKIENISPSRPGSTFEPFAKFLIRDIALGLCLPPEFVYDPASVGGAGMRFVVAKAQRRFEQRQRLLIDRFCHRAWRFFISRAIAAGDLPDAPDYERVSWQTPKSLTVDAGREAQQAREDYKAGLTSLQDYFGELGQDWQEQVEQMDREKKFIAALNPPAPAPAAPTPPAPAPAAALSTPTYSQPDDPDFQLSEKELSMVSDALGLQDKKKAAEKADLARPTAGMIAEAKRGLEWRRQYGRGGTAVGVARARDIINNVDFPDETIARISSYLARHEVDKQGQGFSPGEPGYPSAGRIAWALWGGDPAQSWAAGQMRRIRAQLAKRPGPRSKSQTPAPARDRIRGSDENRPGSAAARSTGGSIEISASTEETLKTKIADFKKRYPRRKAPSLGTLKKVYRRGAGAYSASHRPTIGGGAPNSRGAWAIARVNMFLKMVSGGQVKKSYREADGDLA
jgi:lambda family phage portal protein